MGRGLDWAVQDVAQRRQWLVDGRKPREMRALRTEWSLESTETKIKQLRRGAVLTEIETAVTETPRQTLSVLRRRSALDTSRSTLWRTLREDLQVSSPSVRHD